MNRAKGSFSPSGSFGPGRIGKSKWPGCPRGRRRFRPVVTELEERRLLTNYTLTTLATFNGADLTQADYGGVTLDAQGNLYGTTFSGGAYNDGTVYEVAKGSNTISTLASFNGSNGTLPLGGVVVDGQGDLYGTAYEGGASGAGTVFEIAEGSSTITTLASFNLDNGAGPEAGVVLDGQGNLYGTTLFGGYYGGGTVFEIAKGSNTITTLASFGYDLGTYAGESLEAGVVLDGQGNLYGTTVQGGYYGAGTVYEIAKGSNTITTLTSFNELNRPFPYDGVVVDGQGNVYGADAAYNSSGEPAVFEIAKGSNTITTLASFPSSPGVEIPGAGVVLDAQGNLYGNTLNFFAGVSGTVYEIAKGSSTITTLASFNGPYPSRGLGLVLDSQGDLFGTTGEGNGGGGTVFELSPQTTPVTGTSSPNPSVYGQSVTLSATVVPSTATGTVTFYDGTTSLGTATVVDGTATLATTALPVGSDAITASYGGDANDAAGTSAIFDQVVNQDTTTTTVTASPNPQYAGQPVTLTATVSANAPGGTPTGSVTFFDGTTVLGPGLQTGTISDDWSLTTSSLTPGTHSITGVYSGDSNDAGSTSGSVLQVVNPLLSVSSLTAVAPNPRNTAVSTIDVTFSEAVNTATFFAGALTLTDNGHAVSVPGAALSPVSGTTYAINGLTAFTHAEGSYTLTFNAADIQDQNGNPGAGTLSTSWLMDTMPPTSRVSPLPKTGTSLSFPVTVTGTDPNGAGGSAPSGIASFSIYVSTNGGPWQVWIKQLAPTWTSGNSASATATFTGQSNTIYAFYTVATDAAGNVQAYTPSIEASTYMPDLTPPVTSVDPGNGTNPSSVAPATGTFTLDLNGTAPGGKPLIDFEVYVAIDAQTPAPIGPAIPAGFPDANGVYHATITYQGLTDGTSHSYTFMSVGIDGAGLVQSAPVNPVRFTNQSFTAASLQVTGLTVENGATERSYIRYLDVDFNESDAQSGGALTAIAGSLGSSSPVVQLYKYDLEGDASSKTAVSLLGISTTVLDHAIELDFGAAGLGGNANTTAGDGYYELEVTVGSTTYQHEFYRLLGDVTGDGLVDNNDLAAIATELTLSSPPGYTPLSGDVNGDGSVTAMDQTLATRSKGHKLGTGLPLG